MKEKINENLEHLKSILNNPNDYLIKYFTSFKYEIDDIFDQKYEIEKNSDRKDEIRFAWTNVNKKVEQFKAECVQFAEQSLNEIDLKEINVSVELIASRLTSLDPADNCDDLEEMIAKNEFQLKKILFSSKTAIFLDTLNLSDENLKMLAGMDSKLVFLSNEYISKIGTNDLKKELDTLLFLHSFTLSLLFL